MIWYHGTSEDNWRKIQEEGVLWGIRDGSRCTYLADRMEEAYCYGRIVLLIEYNPGWLTDNYVAECWQIRVYDPIPISNIIRLI